MNHTKRKRNYEKWKKEIITGERFKFIKEEIVKNKPIFIFSLFLLATSIVLDYISGTYTTKLNGALPVQDIILDNIPPLNISILFSYGYLAIVSVFFIYPIFFKIKKLPATIIQFSLLIIIRSFFVVLTHLGSPAGIIPISFPSIFSRLSFENDLFFSGHTAVPFLGFLLFKERKVKYFFLVASIIMGMTVLILHQHYSIDVLSAFFIGYGVYKIGNKLLENTVLHIK